MLKNLRYDILKANKIQEPNMRSKKFEDLKSLL